MLLFIAIVQLLVETSNASHPLVSHILESTRSTTVPRLPENLHQQIASFAPGYEKLPHLTSDESMVTISIYRLKPMPYRIPNVHAEKRNIGHFEMRKKDKITPQDLETLVRLKLKIPDDVEIFLSLPGAPRGVYEPLYLNYYKPDDPSSTLTVESFSPLSPSNDVTSDNSPRLYLLQGRKETRKSYPDDKPYLKRSWRTFAGIADDDERGAETYHFLDFSRGLFTQQKNKWRETFLTGEFNGGSMRYGTPVDVMLKNSIPVFVKKIRSIYKETQSIEPNPNPSRNRNIRKYFFDPPSPKGWFRSRSIESELQEMAKVFLNLQPKPVMSDVAASARHPPMYLDVLPQDYSLCWRLQGGGYTRSDDLGSVLLGRIYDRRLRKLKELTKFILNTIPFGTDNLKNRFIYPISDNGFEKLYDIDETHPMRFWNWREWASAIQDYERYLYLNDNHKSYERIKRGRLDSP
eukprot:g1374.t1